MKTLRTILVGLGLLLVASSLVAPVKAQSLSYFLKFESGSAPALEGSSTVVGYEKQTILSSYSFTTHNPITVGGSSGNTAGKPIFDGLQCIGTIDSKNLPSLLFSVCAGPTYTTATITGTRLGASPYKFLEVKLGRVLFSNVSVQGTDGDNSIVNFTLVPTTILITTYPQNADGSAGAAVSRGWDFSRNIAL